MLEKKDQDLNENKLNLFKYDLINEIFQNKLNILFEPVLLFEHSDDNSFYEKEIFEEFYPQLLANF